MEPSKEQAILMAAIREFTEKGFEQASTNQIAKSAGVSKGLVFHYFDSKEKLFEAAVEYAIDFSMKEMDYEHWEMTGNVVADIKKVAELEMLFYKKYPDLFQFILSAFVRPPRKLSEKMTRLFHELESMAPEFIDQVIEKLDLKEDVDRDVLKAVLQSHYNFYSSQTMGLLKAHPEASFEDVLPYADRFLAMMAMSLRGLVKDEKQLRY